MPTLSSRASLLGRVPRSSHEGFLYALSAASLPNLLLTPQESSPSHVPYLNMTYNLSVFFHCLFIHLGSLLSHEDQA